MGDIDLTDRAAIAGIGATEFSKASGRSEFRLACEAIASALEDCGIERAEVDGLVTFSMDTNSEIEIARAMGMGELTFFSRIGYGGGAACGVLQQAMLAVATGTAQVVVVYRAFNERSGVRFGSGAQSARPAIPNTDTARSAWTSPYGLHTPAQQVAMFAQRYLHTYGGTTADFGRISVIDRTHAATNPKAWFYEQPITLEDHQSSRWISEPLRLLDCCQETDGAQAIVVTSLERARDLRQPPVRLAAAAQGSGSNQQMMTSYYDRDLSQLPEMGLVGRQLFASAGIGTDDVDVAILYDHFTPFVLVQLEELGFCAPGEAAALAASGELEMGGSLPLNPHGGQLGEAYLHGMNGIAEGVRQIRGTAANQVADVEHVLVTAGTGVPTSGAILRVDR